jgi:putative DNA primase/helicase
MLLTAPVRRAFPIAPAFAADSNEPESGKSMLIKGVGALMTGREIAGRPFATNEEERRKALGTAFMQGCPMLFWDNVDSVIEGASMEMALTSATFEDRKLGAHEGFNAPTNVLQAFTGNHLSVGGDGMTSRIYVSKIVPTETLAQRLTDGDFRHPMLIDWIIENRPALIAAALTALRAFILHGRDSMPSTKSRFVQWGNTIGNALIWYGYQDPVRGGDGLRASDPVREAMREVMKAWKSRAKFQAVTAAELLGHDTVKAAIAGAMGVREIDLTPIKAASYINKMVGVNLGGVWRVKVQPQIGYRSTRKWCLDCPDDLDFLD